MTIEPDLVVIIAATLIFYLRLIILQRQRAKQAARSAREITKTGTKGIKKNSATKPEMGSSYSILSSRRSDQIVAGTGFLIILFGILLNLGVLPLGNLQAYWWVPTAAGIVAFSWAFRL